MPSAFAPPCTCVVVDWVPFVAPCICVVIDWALQFEVATGKFPYSRWMTFFDQIQQVVEGDPPRLPSGTFSTVFEEFVGLWSVDCYHQLVYVHI